MRSCTLLTALSLLLACASVAASDPPEPCHREFLPAALSVNILDISVTASELSLLNGSENPKLRRVMALRLRSAISDADEAENYTGRPKITPGAVVDTMQRYSCNLHVGDRAVDAGEQVGDHAGRSSRVPLRSRTRTSEVVTRQLEPYPTPVIFDPRLRRTQRGKRSSSHVL